MRCASDLSFMTAILQHGFHRRFPAAQRTIRVFEPTIACAPRNSRHEPTRRLWCDVSAQRGWATSLTPKTRQERNRLYSMFFAMRQPRVARCSCAYSATQVCFANSLSATQVCFADSLSATQVCFADSLLATQVCCADSRYLVRTRFGRATTPVDPQRRQEPPGLKPGIWL
jgi:hypothetical protein